jgi:Rrf2 family protein
MKLITRDTDYAVRVLLYMAKQKGKIVSATDLVGKLNIPKAFLRRILQELSKTGFLKSQKGKGGGFELAVSPVGIKISDLIKIFQGEMSFSECLFKKKICPNTKTCPLRCKIKNIESKIIKELEGITISSLAKG